MALSIEQQNQINKRANAGESGSALAKEYGVSASTISKLKNHYTPTTDATGKNTSSEKPEVKVAVVSSVSEVSPGAPVNTSTGTNKKTTRTVVINSNKFIGESFEVKATTLGELLDEIKESDAVKAIFKGADGARRTLAKSTDRLPDTNGQPLYMFLTPVKTNAGK